MYHLKPRHHRTVAADCTARVARILDNRNGTFEVVAVDAGEPTGVSVFNVHTEQRATALADKWVQTGTL